MKGVALAQGSLHAVRGTGEGERQLKNAKTEYSSEAEEIAQYTSIETVANAVGDRETARLARGIRRQEERMASFLERVIPMLAKEVVQEEIPASERNGGRKRSTASRSNGASRSGGSRRTAASGRSRSGSSPRSKSSSRSGSSRKAGYIAWPCRVGRQRLVIAPQLGLVAQRLLGASQHGGVAQWLLARLAEHHVRTRPHEAQRQTRRPAAPARRPLAAAPGRGSR